MNPDAVEAAINNSVTPHILANQVKSMLTFSIWAVKYNPERVNTEREIVVASAAPTIPIVGMSTMFNTIFVIAEIMTSFKLMSGRPTPAKEPPMARNVEPFTTVPIKSICNGATVCMNPSPNISVIMSLAKRPIPKVSGSRIHAAYFMLLLTITCSFA